MVMDNHKPCILLTSQKKARTSTYDFGKMVIRQYGFRWNIEKVSRFQKQQLDLENVRLKSIAALRNLISIIYTLSSFSPASSLSILNLNSWLRH